MKEFETKSRQESQSSATRIVVSESRGEALLKVDDPWGLYLDSDTAFGVMVAIAKHAGFDYIVEDGVLTVDKPMSKEVLKGTVDEMYGENMGLEYSTLPPAHQKMIRTIVQLRARQLEKDCK